MHAVLVLPLGALGLAAALVQGSQPIGRAWFASLVRSFGEFGLEVPAEKALQVWDSSAEVRYLVLPERPEGTEGLSEAQLAALVPRGS